VVLLLDEIDCSKYCVKRVSQKCISVLACAILYNRKCEVESINEI